MLARQVDLSSSNFAWSTEQPAAKGRFAPQPARRLEREAARW